RSRRTAHQQGMKLSFFLSLSLSLCISISLSPSLLLSHTVSLSLSHTHTHTDRETHTHTHTDHMYTRTVFEVVLIKAPAKGIKVTIIFSLTNINGLDMCFVLFSLDRRYCSLSLRGYILVILIKKEK